MYATCLCYLKCAEVGIDIAVYLKWYLTFGLLRSHDQGRVTVNDTCHPLSRGSVSYAVFPIFCRLTLCIFSRQYIRLVYIMICYSRPAQKVPVVAVAARPPNHLSDRPFRAAQAPVLRKGKPATCALASCCPSFSEYSFERFPTYSENLHKCLQAPGFREEDRTISPTLLVRRKQYLASIVLRGRSQL